MHCTRLRSIWSLALNRFVFILVWVGLLQAARGVTLVEEEFDYVPDTAVHGATGGFGWSDAWSDPNSLEISPYTTVRTPGLTNPAVIQDAGGYAQFPLDNSIQRTLATTLPAANGSSLWVGFLFKKDRPYGFQDAVENFNLLLNTSSGTLGLGMVIAVKKNDNGSFDSSQDTIAIRSAGALAVADVPALLTSTFVAVHLEIGIVNETVSVFLNPDIHSEPVTPLIRSTNFPNVTNIAKVYISGEVDAPELSPVFIDFDEFRIGETYYDVIPEPSSSLLAFTGLVFLSRRVRRRV